MKGSLTVAQPFRKQGGLSSPLWPTAIHPRFQKEHPTGEPQKSKTLPPRRLGRRKKGRKKSGPERQTSVSNLLWPTSCLSGAAFNARDHLGTAEIDGAPAAQRRSVLNKDDLFIVAHALEDLFGLNQPSGDLLLAGGLMGRPGAVIPTRG